MRTRRSPRCLLASALAGSTAIFTLTALAQPPAAPAPPAPVAAPDASAQRLYLQPGAIDVRALLPEPAPVGSAMEAAELDLVRAVMQSASPEARARAEREVAMTPAIFKDVLGEQFTPANCPRTFALLGQVAREAKAISDKAKADYARPRPATNTHGGTEMEKSNSYPSGHSTRAAVWCEVLCALYPDRAEGLRARAALVGYGRIVLGVHYPSDVAAGRVLGVEIVKRMHESPAFTSDLEAARAEVLPAAPTQPMPASAGPAALPAMPAQPSSPAALPK